MAMNASTCVRIIDATRKRLPRTVSNKWAHLFLDDVRDQLKGGYRATLTPAQTGHLLRTVDHAGVDLDAFNRDLSESGTGKPNGRNFGDGETS